MISRNLFVGEKLWYLPGLQNHNCLFIECEITKKIDGQYWVNEPLLEPIDINSAFLEKKEAKKYLHYSLSRIGECYRTTLQDFREAQRTIYEFNDIKWPKFRSMKKVNWFNISELEKRWFF